MIVTVGKRLLARPGSYQHSPTPGAFTYQWQRADEWGTPSSWANIGGATSAVYEVVSADKERLLRCAITATNVFGSVVTYTVPFIVADGRSALAFTFGYGQPEGRRENESIIETLPGTSPNSPCALFLHGGGFIEQGTNGPAPGEATEPPTEKADNPECFSEAQSFVNKGWAAFVLNWRQSIPATSPEYTPTYIQQQDDIRAALGFIRANAERFNGDPGRISIVGGSSGGTLALMAASKLNELKPGFVRGCAVLSGLSNLYTRITKTNELIAEAIAKSEEPDVQLKNHLGHIGAFAGIDKDRLAEAAWLASADGGPARRRLLDLSPTEYIAPGAPKVIFWISEKETATDTDDQGKSLVTAYTAAGIASSIDYKLRVGQSGHAFAYWASVGGEADTFLKAA